MSAPVQRSATLAMEKPSNYINGKSADLNMNMAESRTGPITLSVSLPDGTVKQVVVDASMPMMDLLVHVTSKWKLKPGEHLIQVKSEDTGRTLNYQSSQAIGSLDVDFIYLLNKNLQREEKEKTLQRQKDISKFQPTIRVTINLPRGVKALQRLNPGQPIMDIFLKLCAERGLDPSKYEVRLTKSPEQEVDMAQTLNDYQTNEISLMLCAAPDYRSSMIDISRAGQQPQPDSIDTKMAESFQKIKKKKGLLAFFSRNKKPPPPPPSEKVELKDENQNPAVMKRLDDTARSMSVQGLSTSSTMTNKPRAQIRPLSQVQPTINEVDSVDTGVKKVKPSNKKKKAPLPPPPRPTNAVVDKPTAMYSSTPSLVMNESKGANSRRQPIGLSIHSRNSSDSSGYHDQLSPNSSPSDSSTLPRNDKQRASASGLNKPRPQIAVVQRSQTLPASSQPVSRKGKKKAPAPPGATSILAPAITKQETTTKPALPHFIHDSIIESEEDTGSVTSKDDCSLHGPELGIISAHDKGPPPPIFIPPPPPESPPPDPQALIPKPQTNSPIDLKRDLTKTVTANEDIAFHSRSDSRCSRTSVNTIDDIQQYFNLAIAAGEEGLSRSPYHAVDLKRPTSITDMEVADIAEQITAMTDSLKSKTNQDRSMSTQSEKSDTSQDAALDAAMAELDQCTEEHSDNASTLDGEDKSNSPGLTGAKFQVSADPQASVRSTVSLGSQKGYVKPVEEISYGFDNPFRGTVPLISLNEPRKPDLPAPPTRRDSQISDSTLPESDMTDRQLSGSLQSSLIQSDVDEESVTETGDGYDTTGTEKALSHSENEVSQADISGGPIPVVQAISKKDGRGVFFEAKGQEVNKVIYGDVEAGSVRGVPGQVKNHSASFDKEELISVRPKSVFGLLTTPAVTSDAPKRRSLYSAVKVESENVKIVEPEIKKPPPLAAKPKTTLPSKTMRSSSSIKTTVAVTKTNSENKTNGASISTSGLRSRPLPVYNRMSSQPQTPEGSAKPLASLITESMSNGETSKGKMRTTPDTAPQTMFFGANRNSISNVTTKQVIENRVRLDTKYNSSSSVSLVTGSGPSSIKNDTTDSVKPVDTQPGIREKPKPGASTIRRKESLKEQMKKAQDNFAKWQEQLKENENRVKTLTASQQNLSSLGVTPDNPQPETYSASNNMAKSSTTANLTAVKPFGKSDQYQSVPTELHKVALKSAARRVIEKAPPEMGVVDILMQSIRDRGGRVAEDAPERRIYVADGDRASVDETVAEREVAPSVANSGISPLSSSSQMPPPPPPTTTSNPTPPAKPSSHHNSRKIKTSEKRTSDPRFNQPEDPRENLLNEIKNRAGKPGRSRRRATMEINGMDSSSQSSSDELKELEIRHKPTRSNKPKSKRSISDPFPPQYTNGHHRVQPQTTQLEPREELMIAIRNSGGLKSLREVQADEIRWSAQV